MITWTTIENAIHAWVVAGTGLFTANVIWSQQAGPRPSGTYIALRAAGIVRIGQDWVDVVDASSPLPGSEIEHRVRGVRELLIRMQCFAPDNAVGSGSPVALLNRLVAWTRLPSARNALQAAGIGVARFAPVQGIDGVLGSSVFEPRGILEARAFLAEEISESGTYIEFAEIENEIRDDIFTVPRPVSGGPLAKTLGTLSVTGTGTVV